MGHTNQRVSRTALLALAAHLLISAHSSAQSIQGSMVGTVTDATGAGVPNVKVTAMNERTSFARSTQTNESGLYELPNLEPSEYTIKAEASGFKSYANTKVRLANREALRIDIKLDVGDVAQEVTVEGQVPVVRTEDAKIDSGMTFQYLDQRPTNSAHGFGLTAIEATRTLPGVYYSRVFGDDGTGVMITGARSNQTSVNVMGVKQVQFQTYNAALSAMEEVKIERFNTPAEYLSPATVEMTLRSGTRDIHGEFGVDLRNQRLVAGNFFNPRPPVGAPDYVAYFNVGTPVYIPKIYPRRNRTFLFLAVERNKRLNFESAGLFSVPTTTMRNGDFNTLRFGNNPVTLNDPLTGQPFPNKTIPANRVSPVARNIMALYPLPNTADPNAPIANYLGKLVTINAPRVLSMRGDHNLTSKQTINGTFTQYLRESAQIPSGGMADLYLQKDPLRVRSASIAWTYALNGNAVNEFRGGVTRFFQGRETAPLSFSGRGKDWLSKMGIQGLEDAPDGLAMPRLTIRELSSTASIGIAQAVTARTYYTVIDNFSFLTRNHAIKMGVHAHFYQRNTLGIPESAYGNLNFTGRFSGVGFGDFLLGVPDTTNVSSPRPTVAGRYQDVGLYIQDKWTVTPKLTFTYGIRNDFWTVPHDADGMFFNFDPRTGSVVLPGSAARGRVNPLWPSNIPLVTADQAQFPAKLRRINRLNLAPRLGLAWRPAGDKTVLRAGFGVYRTGVSFDSLTPFTEGPYSLAQTFLNQYDARTQSFLFQFPRVTPATQSSVPVAAPGSISFGAINPDASRIPYTAQWSFTVDRQVLRDTRVSVSYLGSKVTHLMYGRNINVPLPSTTPFSQNRRPYPLFNAITWYENGGNQSYHSMETMLYRRFSGGFQFEGGWAWANALNDVEDAGSDLGPSLRNPFFREKGRQEAVVQHSLKGTFVFEFPFGKGRALFSGAPKVVDAIIGGWRTANSFEFRTGDWFTPVFNGRDVSGTGINTGVPDRICDGNIPGPKNFRNLNGDLSCFAIPAANSGRFGNSGRGILVGANNKFWNSSLFKEFRIHERARLRIGCQSQTTFNWLSLGTPNGDITSPNGFRATGSAKGTPAGRNLEFVGRISF
jgi:hypothetical protein